MSSAKISIWRLIQRYAEELTRAGQSPFTRGDLIKCVQRRNPEYADNSINPIIQGVTDNLRGGAPGAVGKNILHSVSRGQFVLLSEGKAASKIVEPKPLVRKQPSAVKVLSTLKSGKSISLEGFTFQFVCPIEPTKNQDGLITEFMPQSRFRNEGGLPLSKYGGGPFCKFKIPRGLELAGVYALLSGRTVKYIGECQQLSSRFNMGYGNISPRNCFRGGQETNCRLNNQILQSASNGEGISLWFYETDQYKEVELTLRAKLKAEWNQA